MIVVRDVRKYFDGGLVRALDGVSFSVQKGEIVAVTGPSGCGKSTLLNLLGALELPTEGSIWIAEKEIREYRPYDRFRSDTIGFVFQFHHLLPAFSLFENVEIPMYSQPVTRTERRRRAVELLERMGLEERMYFLPTRVSGGERQRAAIARALVNRPKIILADEPTGSVDTETGRGILDFLTAECRDKNITMLVATHNPEIASRADRVIRLKNGLVQEGPIGG